MSSYIDYIERSRIFLEEAKAALNKGIYWLACFHAHQSVEFYLKGLLEYKTGSYPFTHDLTYLLKIVANILNLTLPEDLKVKAEALSPHYTLSRYGGLGVSEYTEDKASSCISYAEEILEWLKEKV